MSPNLQKRKRVRKKIKPYHCGRIFSVSFPLTSVQCSLAQKCTPPSTMNTGEKATPGERALGMHVHTEGEPSASLADRKEPRLTQREPGLGSPSGRPACAKFQRSRAVLRSGVCNQKAPDGLTTSYKPRCVPDESLVIKTDVSFSRKNNTQAAV